MIELLILYTLIDKEHTMYGISTFIDENFGAYTKPSFGAISPALKRLEKAGFIRTRKTMSDGGKLSVFYSDTQSGLEELKRLILQPVSQNPLQFFSTAGVKISCAGFLAQDERAKLFLNLKSCALKHKNAATKSLEGNKNSVGFYQRIMLDNSVCEYNNFIRTIEALEKENGG